MRRHSRELTLLLALAAGLLGLFVVSVPQFDPQGWMLWVRGIATPGHVFDTTSFPSWKPLPVLLGLPLGALGSAAPAAWLVLERALAVLGLVAAWRLARPYGGRVG